MKALRWLVFVVVGFFAYVLISSDRAMEGGASVGDGVVTAVTADTFHAVVLESRRPVLVEFWAEWCGPCRKAAPWVRQIAGDLEGQLDVATVDVDAAPQLAEQYKVRGIPSFMLVDGGRVLDRFSGLNEAMVTSRLESAGFSR